MKTQYPIQSEAIKPILDRFRQELQREYQEKLLGMILFGSYARGDFHQDSDVDLLLLFSEGTHINHETKKVMGIAYDFILESGYFLMPMLTTENLFDKNSPLYLNIKKEGIKI